VSFRARTLRKYGKCIVETAITLARLRTKGIFINARPVLRQPVEEHILVENVSEKRLEGLIPRQIDFYLPGIKGEGGVP
jgi:hypothetical protein